MNLSFPCCVLFPWVNWVFLSSSNWLTNPTNDWVLAFSTLYLRPGSLIEKGMKPLLTMSPCGLDLSASSLTKRGTTYSNPCPPLDVCGTRHAFLWRTRPVTLTKEIIFKNYLFYTAILLDFLCSKEDGCVLTQSVCKRGVWAVPSSKRFTVQHLRLESSCRRSGPRKDRM